MNPKCATVVNTPTGRFTFHKKRMSVCEAKKFCAQRGEILAPVTNKADFDALYKAAREGNNPSCPFHHDDMILYSLGLDITPCGKGKQDRIFTNGVLWDKNVHEKLYTDYQDSWNSNCAYAVMNNGNPKPGIYVWFGCYQKIQRLICLKEAVPSNYSSYSSCSSSVSQAISSDGIYKGYFFSVVFIVCFSIVAVFSALIAIKYHKNYLAVEEEREKMKK